MEENRKQDTEWEILLDELMEMDYGFATWAAETEDK